MTVVFLLLLPCSFRFTAVHADPSFDEKYERDYNIFNPASKYASDIPLNTAHRVRAG